YGKPATRADAAEMLGILRGRMHVVISGISICADGELHTHAAKTGVCFREFSVAELDRYLATDEWQGRAGGYAIQGTGALLVDEIEGCYANVVGFPVSCFVDMVTKLGLYDRVFIAAAPAVVSRHLG